MIGNYGTPAAVAHIRGGETYPRLRGTMRLYARPNGTLVQVQVSGLPETATNFFALHIHEGGDCRGIGFPDSGSHYNPEGLPHPQHAGDLPPLLSSDGSAYLVVFTNRFQVRDVLGRTAIIHIAPDDFTTQPSGNSGAKIACGVIGRI